MLAGCVTVPTGPAVMVLPGTGKNFDQFRSDDFDCRGFANAQVGGATQESAAVDSGVRSAAIGTAIGAVAGAAFGGRDGAAVGAGTGLIFGSAVGAGTAGASQYTLQQRYDIAYTQCMYARGHKVPSASSNGNAYRRSSGTTYSTPPPPPPPGTNSSSIPPPPPGSPPPPPPGAN